MSPQFKADFSQAKHFILVPVGVYNVHVKSCVLSQSKKKQEPMLKVQMEIDEVVSLNEGAEFTEEQCMGQSLFPNWMLVGEGSGITESAFTALYGSPEDAPDDTDAIVGSVCAVQVTHRVYAVEDGGDGALRSNISKYMPLLDPSGGVGKLFA